MEEWDLNSRRALMDFCEKHQIPVEGARASEAEPPYSMDANLLHISYEGGELEDPDFSPNEAMWQRTVSVEDSPDTPEEITLSFEHGDPVAIDSKAMSPAQLLTSLNEMAGRHGIGRLDLVENRYVGMKSRGCYETPGGTLLLKGHRAIESLTLDRELAHLKDELMPRYASLIYNGYWWSPEREALQALIDHSQRDVSGDVRLKLFKGNVIVLGRSSKHSLYRSSLASFEDDLGAYDQHDAEGFIRLNALRLKLGARGRSD